MVTPDPHRVNELRVGALRLPPGERAAFLDDACASDDVLREAVEQKLAQEGATILSGPQPIDLGSSDDTALKASPPEEIDEAPGSLIGRYRLLQVIGEGGFGRVFMAEQTEPVVRRVALKIIKLGMDTRQVIARFQAERQALALMDHPNIAHVFDAGATDGGRPYFVMELIRGDPITEFCTRESLTTRERVALMVQVCRAAHHAAQRGIIHRDIKPGNILVGMQDGHPVPKVIDFGIAKATDHRLTERTLFTQFHQMIGTPEYMSPEQASGSPDIDARTDVYSLGVVLYELLTGHLPYDVADRSLPQIAKMIQEQKPTPPSRYDRRLKGDLDVILLTALRKDRERRYASAADLADDLERMLDSRALSARRDSIAYMIAAKSRAAVMRHPVGTTLLAIATATLLAYWPGTPLVFNWTPLGAWFERTAHAVGSVPNQVAFEHVIVIAMTSKEQIEAVAKREGISPVDFNAPWTLRALHGRLMERLADTGVKAVVWDMYFPRERITDAAFVSGMRALRRPESGTHGKGVVIGLPSWWLGGLGGGEVPASMVSATILEEARRQENPPLPLVAFGATTFDSGTWKLDLIAQREGRASPSLALAAYAAATRPAHEPLFTLAESAIEGAGKIEIRYRDPASGEHSPPQYIRISSPGAAGEDVDGLKTDDLVGYLILPMPPDEVLEDPKTTIPYHEVFGDTSINEDLRGKVVVIANFLVGDLHRHPDGRMLQGAYTHAVALEMLLGGSVILLPRPVHILGLIIAGAVIGVAISWMVPRRPWLRYVIIAAVAATCAGGSLVAFRFMDYLCIPAVPVFSMLVATVLSAHIVHVKLGGVS